MNRITAGKWTRLDVRGTWITLPRAGLHGIQINKIYRKPFNKLQHPGLTPILLCYNPPPLPHDYNPTRKTLIQHKQPPRSKP